MGFENDYDEDLFWTDDEADYYLGDPEDEYPREPDCE